MHGTNEMLITTEQNELRNAVKREAKFHKLHLDTIISIMESTYNNTEQSMMEVAYALYKSKRASIKNLRAACDRLGLADVHDYWE